MTAARHLQGEQLRMFMPAGELMAQEPNYADYNLYAAGQHDEMAWKEEMDEPVESWMQPSREGFWEQKLEEAGGDFDRADIRTSIEEEGVKRPVVLHHQGTGVMIANGHHRIASAYHDIGPDELVPVVHYGAEHTPFHDAVWERDRRK